MSKTIAEMAAEICTLNVDKGWRPADGGPGANTFGDYLALLHSEVSEALEAYRDHRLADATTGPGCAEPSCPDFGSSDFGEATCPEDHANIPKPEGVGSELADVLIRLLDTADAFDVMLREMDPSDCDAGGMESFGDHLAWLHYLIATLPFPDDDEGDVTYSFSELLQAVHVVAERYGIDLAAEYERKMTYNRTRPYQHGGRTLTDTDGGAR